MHIIIIGCGKVGSRLAYILFQEGHEVVIIDSDRKSFSLLDPEFSGVTITGVPIDQDILKQAGIESADALISVTPDDNINIMACQVAKEFFQVKRVLARIYNPKRENVFHEFGLNTICPTNVTVEVMKSRLLGSEGETYHNIGDIEMNFRHEKVTKKIEGKKVKDIKMADNNCFLFGIIKNNNFVFAKQNININKDDILVIAEK
ncbi:MAG: TrkA family potassium uptake protein [Clostridiales bacterium]